jgi:hypothetical protein
MFNFRSLAEMMGREEKENEAKHLEHSGTGGPEIGEGESSLIEHNNSEEKMEQSVTTLKADLGDRYEALEDTTKHNGDSALLGTASKLPTPELMVTPVTPGAGGSKEEG